MTFRLAGFAAGLSLALPLAAGAQPVSGPYVGGGAGMNLWQESTTRGFRIHDEDLGFVGLGSLGWGFGNGLRVEAEGNYRESEIDRITGPAGRVGSSGYLRNYGVMGNVLFDFDLSSFGIRPESLMPYIGGGAGYVWTDIRNARLNIGGSGYRLDDSDGNLAYQAILGAAAQDGFQPGMQQYVDPAEIYARALKRLKKLAPLEGPPPRPLPETVAFTATELRDEEFGAVDLLDRIRSAVSPP